MNTFIQFGAALLAAIPFIIIAVIGIFFAFTRRTAHPRASLLVSLGLLGLLLNAFGGAALQVWVQGQQVAADGAIAYGHQLVMFNIGLYGLHLTGLVLITMAVFAGRDGVRREP
jgi:hypothetical protein